MKKVIFLDEIHPYLQEKLEAAGWICDQDYKSSYEEILEKIHHYEGIVIRSRIPLDRRLIDKASQLEFIARSGSGLENIDVEYAKSKGIHIINSPEGNRDAVAEHVIGMILSLFNRLCINHQKVIDGIWDREGGRGIELKEKTFAIIGFGQMGSAVAQRLQSFDCNILAYDKYKKNYAPSYVKETTLDEIYQRADIVSIHLPLSKETKHWLNSEKIEKFKKQFYLINTARGQHVVLKDLLIAIEKGKIAGAALDVLELEASYFELEQHQNKEILKKLAATQKVLFTPHVAGWTVESYFKLSWVLYNKLKLLYPSLQEG
ncbi:MAG: 2-hydroxyacid dehydrogenase [Vicingaceae bacterium]|nr:MAG: 2-hydroxyacid dehydrogenase [Vicingaceae bacterium]